MIWGLWKDKTIFDTVTLIISNIAIIKMLNVMPLGQEAPDDGNWTTLYFLPGGKNIKHSLQRAVGCPDKWVPSGYMHIAYLGSLST